MEDKSQQSKQKGGEERMKHKTKKIVPSLKIEPSLLKAIKREVARAIG